MGQSLSTVTIAAFSASAPASSPAGGIADGEGVPDESAGDPSGRIGSSEPGCFVSSDIMACGSSMTTLRLADKTTRGLHCDC